MQEIFAKIRARLADKEAEHFEDYNTYGHGEDYRLSLCYADAIEIVNDVEAEHVADTNVGKSDGWIPCSERLPRRNKDVLVYRPKMAMPILVDRYEGYYGEDDEEWYEGWTYSENTAVIAWQPLPAPYQPKGE